MSEGLQIQPLGISFQILHHNYTTLLSFLVVSTRKIQKLLFADKSMKNHKVEEYREIEWRARCWFYQRKMLLLWFNENSKENI